MGIITWIVLGGVSGWIVSLIMKTNEEQGFFGNIAVGVVGALIGGFLGDKLFGSEVTGFNISSIVLSVVGGALFVFIWKMLAGNKAI